MKINKSFKSPALISHYLSYARVSKTSRDMVLEAHLENYFNLVICIAVKHNKDISIEFIYLLLIF